DAELLRLLDVWRQLPQHREASGAVKSTDADRQSRCKKRPRKVHRARKLVCLHADERDQPCPAAIADRPNDSMRTNASIGFVIDMKAYVNGRTEDSSAPRIFGKSVHTGQRIGWDDRSHPLDRVP